MNIGEPTRRRPWTIGSGALPWSVMGVLNVTPDSFSDGGAFIDPAVAVEAAVQMQRDGAHIIDIGGESTRPNAKPVSPDEELRRVLPVIEALQRDPRFSLPISIDTTKAVVAAGAVRAGAEIVNDISGGRFDSAMISTVAELGSVYVCGHVRGSSVEQVHSSSASSRADVVAEMLHCAEQLPHSLHGRTIFDPCLGFGKDLHVNLALIENSGGLSEELGAPILLGPSRKRFLGEVTSLPTGDRDGAGVGACLAGLQAGASIFRVHAVPMVVSALQMFCAIQQQDAQPWSSAHDE